MYFEDYKIGDKFYIDETSVYEDEMIEFAKNYDPRPFHIDEEESKKTRFENIIASGFFTLSFAWSKWVKTKKDEEGIIAGAGINNLRWKNPVYANDILKSTLTVLGKDKSKNKNQGIVTLSYQTFNQDEKEVLYFEAKVLVKRKNNN